MLTRVQRNFAIALLAVAGLALVLDPARPNAAAAVLGGGALVALSYAAVALTVRTFVGNPDRARQSAGMRVLVLAFFVGHYALLAFAAYVMIARLRLHPIGLLGGVTSFVLAVAAEAARRTRN